MTKSPNEIENPGRERILARIRAALREPAPRHASSSSSQPIFAPIPDPLARYLAECLANKTECILVKSEQESVAAVKNVLAELPPGEIFLQDAPLLRRMSAQWSDGRPIRWSSEDGPAESSQTTITLTELLVAQTGSLFVSAACGGRGASIVAPVHMVVADISQLVPDLATAFVRLRESGALEKNSFLGLITGSSRTSDIEKNLVMGAHGPRRLVVILSVGDSSTR